jgi:hypothetical protein
MTKDLFAILFKTFSRWSYQEYYVNFIDRLPHRFLQGALTANRELDSCSGFAELQELLASQSGPRWKNPELYPHLNRVIIPNYSFLQEHVDALRIHVGLQALTPATKPASRFWRLRDPTFEVVEVIEGCVNKVDGLLVPVAMTQPFPVVYCPYPNLFDDVEKKLYRGEGFEGDQKLLCQLTTDAFQLMNKYSTDIACGFRREINTVAFMARQHGGTKSFSLRNFYIGGIFVSVGDPIMLAEQFIHEYYHQCIWPWWMIEPPADLPGDEQTIISPVTGRVRPVSVMIHALLIYYSLADFYRFVLSASESSAYDASQLNDAQARLTRIETGARPLFRALDGALSRCPRSRAIVEVIADAATTQ